jgi:hypothetical protein
MIRLERPSLGLFVSPGGLYFKDGQGRKPFATCAMEGVPRADSKKPKGWKITINRIIQGQRFKPGLPSFQQNPS